MKEKEDIIPSLLEQLATLSSELLKLKISLENNKLFKAINYSSEIHFENMVERKKPLITYYLHSELSKEIGDTHTLAMELELSFSKEYSINAYISWIAYDGLGLDVFDETFAYSNIEQLIEGIESNFKHWKEVYLKTIDETL